MLPLHASVLQASTSTASPGQSNPPSPGGGLLHFLLLVLIPPSHDAEHGDQLSHSDQPPLTSNESNHISKYTDQQQQH